MAENKQNNTEPQLSRGMKIFIVVGAIFLLVFGLMYYVDHRNDPDYFRTQIEPDSTQRDRVVLAIDTSRKDTLSKDSIDKEENEKAEKVLNSIRKKHRSKESAPSEESVVEGSEEGTQAPEESQSEQPTTAPVPSAPKPKVESVEQ